ncbi:hypothetical protein [Actinocrispum sp. NPDC049592]|uniref:hypothetical protein n=1 Tax=Actinocrispum sp. NPDC049592 TaxID=3154835 RepID=UPI00343FC77E
MRHLWADRTGARRHGSWSGDGGISTHQAARTLLGLLAANLTDESIAPCPGGRLAGVQHRVHDLMREFNVVTRFQLGLAARDKDWD